MEYRRKSDAKKPSLNQFTGLDWEVIDLTDMKQTLTDRHRENFIVVAWLPVLRGQRKVINWLADNQIDEGVKPH